VVNTGLRTGEQLDVRRRVAVFRRELMSLGSVYSDDVLHAAALTSAPPTAAADDVTVMTSLIQPGDVTACRCSTAETGLAPRELAIASLLLGS